MKDIFDAKVMCENCDKIMKPRLVSKNGFNLRAVKCEECGDAIIHPVDMQEYENFMRLKEKEYSVKMRMVGNSYAVSIPREIVDFMREQEKMMDDMVKLCFEEAGRISLSFNTPENGLENSRVVKSKEIKFIKNNKPLFHVKQYSDVSNGDKPIREHPKNEEHRFLSSSDPRNNKTKVYKSEELEEEEN